MSSVFADETERMLWQESWRSERQINVYRAAVWIVACAGIMVADLDRDYLLNKGVAAGAMYGIACAVLSATWLRRSYHAAVPFALSSLDVVFLGVIASRTQIHLEATQPTVAAYNLYVMHASFMLLLLANVLRFSWKVAAWSTFMVVATYGTLTIIHGATEMVTVGFNIAHLVAMGVVLVYAARKLRNVIRRVEERNALARFLPGPIVEQVSEDPSKLALGGKERQASVLIADIRGFTTLSEKLRPTEVVELLNEYFDEMVTEIFSWDGILDKFIGDGIIAVFTEQGDESDHAERAIRCGRGMLRRLEALNHKRVKRDAPALRIGIGIHSGVVVAGNVGSAMRMEYTHIGDTVNTASRIEGLTKPLKVPLLISGATMERAGDIDFEFEALGPHELRGRPRPVELFAVR
jgi:adenylate cyclase